jgi:predicted Zn finger-like uncharacterized protein
MKITCPTCNTVYHLPDHKVPTKSAKAQCKKCGGVIPVEPLRTDRPLESPVDETGQTPAATSQEPPPLEKDHPLFSEFPELVNLPLKRFVLEEILPPNRKGKYRYGKNKYKVKILKAVHEKLAAILQDSEKVFRIGRGTAYYPLEIFLGNGLLTMMYNHYALAATSKRLLFININARTTHPTHYLFQMPYQDVAKIKSGIFSTSLILYRKAGGRRIFMYVKRHISKAFQAFVKERTAEAGTAGKPLSANENLCPECFAALEKKLKQCPACSTPFKEPRKALIRSLILPGLGDIYLGHRFLGILEMVGSLVVWFLVLSFLISGQAEGIVSAAILLLFYNGLDALLTYHMAKKGYMAAARQSP